MAESLYSIREAPLEDSESEADSDGVGASWGQPKATVSGAWAADDSGTDRVDEAIDATIRAAKAPSHKQKASKNGGMSKPPPTKKPKKPAKNPFSASSASLEPRSPALVASSTATQAPRSSSGNSTVTYRRIAAEVSRHRQGKKVLKNIPRSHPVVHTIATSITSSGIPVPGQLPLAPSSTLGAQLDGHTIPAYSLQEILRRYAQPEHIDVAVLNVRNGIMNNIRSIDEVSAALGKNATTHISLVANFSAIASSNPSAATLASLEATLARLTSETATLQSTLHALREEIMVGQMGMLELERMSEHWRLAMLTHTRGTRHARLGTDELTGEAASAAALRTLIDPLSCR